MATLGNNALTTVANLQEKLRIGSVETDRLTNIINRVTERVEALTERKLLARNYDGSTTHGGTSIAAESPLYFNWNKLVQYADGSFRLHLPSYPIQTGGGNDIAFSIEALLSRSNSGGEVWDTALLENDDYILEEVEDGVVAFLSFPTMASLQGTGNGIRQYRVKGTLGYNAIPDQLEEVILELAVAMYRDSHNIASERLDSWARTYDTTKENPAIAAGLGQYTRYEI